MAVCPGVSPRGHLTHCDMSAVVDHLVLFPLLSSLALFAGGSLILLLSSFRFRRNFALACLNSAS